MARPGSFDPALVPAAWFDETAQAAGWFDDSIVQQAAGGGTATLTDAGAIASGEAFGTPTLQLGATVTDAGGIASAESVNTPTLALGDDITDAGGIASAESVPAPVLQLGATLTAAGDIASAEAFGSPTVTGSDGSATITDAGGIDSAESVSAPALIGTSPGPVAGGTPRPRIQHYPVYLPARPAPHEEEEALALCGAL